jgi:serine protease Do
VGPYDAFIQTDAAINEGNTGGPMFDLKGQVVGINTSIVSPSGGSVGVGFAVPSSIAKGVIHQLRTYGRPRLGKLGVEIQAVTKELAQALGLEGRTGAIVVKVAPSSPAELAGIQPGDILLEFGGHKITQKRELPQFVAQTAPGSTVDVIVLQNGERLVKTITVGHLEEATRPPGPRAASVLPPANQVLNAVQFAGMTLEQMTPEMRSQHTTPPSVASGVMVTFVEPGSPAAKRDIEVGNVIRQFAQRGVSTLNDLLETIKRLRGESRRTLPLLLLDGNGELRFVALPLGEFLFTRNSSPIGDNHRLPTIMEVQQVLTDLGLDPGPIDGKMGHKTRRAIREFKTAHGLGDDSRITQEFGSALYEELAARKALTASQNKKLPDVDLDELEDLDRLE